MILTGENPELFGDKNYSQRQCVNSKSHKEWAGIETELPGREGGD